jgi:hypothetical protein
MYVSTPPAVLRFRARLQRIGRETVRAAARVCCTMHDIGNLDASGRRMRLTAGVVAIAVGVVLAAALVALDAGTGWRLLTFIPFWAGSLGILQAGTKT